MYCRCLLCQDLDEVLDPKSEQDSPLPLSKGQRDEKASTMSNMVKEAKVAAGAQQRGT